MTEETGTIETPVETETSTPGTETPIEIAEKAVTAQELGMASFMGPQGELKEGWKDGILPEGVRKDPSWDVFANIGDVFKSYIDTKKLVGRKGVILPNENSTEDEWNAYYNATGRPANADDYAFAKPDDIADEHWSQEKATLAQQALHKAGISKVHADIINELNNQFLRAEIKAKEDAQTEAEVLIRTEAKGNYKQMFHDTKLMLSTILPDLPLAIKDGVESAINEAENRPFLFFLLSKLQEGRDEHTIMTGGEVGGERGIQAKIDEEMQKPAYMDANDPAHKRQIALVQSLFQQKAALTEAKT